MLNRTIRSARPLSTRACALLIASAAVFALPWSVTAQATKKATKAKPAVTAKRKHAAKRKKATHKTIRWSSAGSGNGPVVWVTATDKSGSKTQEFTVRTAPAATQSYTVVASGRGGDHPIAYSVTSTPAAKEYTVVTAGKGQSGATQAYSFSSSASSSAPKVVTLTGGKTIVLSGTAPTPMAWSTGDRPRALEFADPAPVAQGGWAESKAGRELSFTSKTVSPEAIWTPGSAGRAIVVMDEPRVSVTSGSGADAKLTVDFEGRDIQSALSQVFRAAKVDFSIRSDVASDKVTVKLTDATLESIVNTILGSVRQPLMFRVEGGVYKIVPRD